MQIYKHILAGPLWQRRNGTDFAFFQSHTGFARGENGGVYEDMLCLDFAPSLHFVNVRAQRYKCPARPGSAFILGASRAASTDGQAPKGPCSTWVFCIQLGAFDLPPGGPKIHVLNKT